MKKYLALAIVGFISISVFVTKDILQFMNIIPWSSIECFDIDSEENIYIGKMRVIEVCNSEGELLRTISPPTSRAFAFYIENDEIILSCATSAGKSARYDLYGNYVQEYSSYYEEVEKEAKQKVKVSESGNEYRLKKYMDVKPYEILRNGEVVYRMAKWDYIFNALPFYVFFACDFVCLGVLILFIVAEKYNEQLRQRERNNVLK